MAAPPTARASNRLSVWFESLGAYRWLFPVVAVVGLLAASRFDFAQGPEARAAALALPVLLAVLALVPFFSAARPLLALAAGVTLLAAGAAELEIVSTVYPPAAIAEVELSGPGAEASMQAPADSLRADVQAHFGKKSHSGEGHVVIALSRNGHSARVEGDVSKSGATSRGSKRRAPQAASSHTLDTVRDDVDLPGSGPVVVKVLTASGSIGKGVTVRTLPAPVLGRKLSIALLALSVIGVALHVFAARLGVRSDFGALTALYCVFGYYLPHHFAANDPMSGVVGALLAALVLGGLLGWIASTLLARVLVPAAL